MLHKDYLYMNSFYQVGQAFVVSGDAIGMLCCLLHLVACGQQQKPIKYLLPLS